MNRQYERAIEVLGAIHEEAGGMFGYGDSPGETLAMAYAMLGRQKEARAQIDGLLEQDPYSSLAYSKILYQHHKRDEDLDFRQDALRRAGLPEWPFGYEGKPEDRLDAAALEEITTGHTWTGWDLGGNNSFVQEFGPGGTTVYASPTALMTGTIYVRGHMLCEMYELFLLGRVQCGYVYRNPDGTPEEANELTMSACSHKRTQAAPQHQPHFGTSRRRWREPSTASSAELMTRVGSPNLRRAHILKKIIVFLCRLYAHDPPVYSTFGAAPTSDKRWPLAPAGRHNFVYLLIEK